MTTTEMSRIEKKIFWRAPRARVWRAITNMEEFAAWFHVKAEGSFQPGVPLRMTSTYENYKGVSFFMVVEKMEAERLFSWRWYPGVHETTGNPSQEPATLVEFTLEDAEGGTDLTVVESGFEQISLVRRAQAFEGNTKGWELQTESLKQYVHGAA